MTPSLLARIPKEAADCTLTLAPLDPGLLEVPAFLVAFLVTFFTIAIMRCSFKIKIELMKLKHRDLI